MPVRLPRISLRFIRASFFKCRFSVPGVRLRGVAPAVIYQWNEFAGNA